MLPAGLLSNDLYFSDNYLYSNWSRTFYCRPKCFIQPHTTDSLIEIFKWAYNEKHKIRIMGAGLSPSDIVCTDNILISLSKLNKLLNVDTDRLTITIQPGMSLTDFSELAHKYNMTLPTLPSIGSASIGGIITSGTHGSGKKNGILASNVVSLKLLCIDGKIMELSENMSPDIFKCSLVSLGYLGAIIEVTIQCVPSFNISQNVVKMTLQDSISKWENFLDEYELYRMHYYPSSNAVYHYLMAKTNKLPNVKYSWFLHRFLRFYVYGVGVIFCRFLPCFYASLEKFFCWLSIDTKHELVDNNYKVEIFDCRFSQYVSEWSIPIEETMTVLQQIDDAIKTEKLTIHGPIEVRFAAADNIYLSPCNGRAVTFLNILSYCPLMIQTPHEKFWNIYENIMKKAKGRPHYCKTHDQNYDDLNKIYGSFWELFITIKTQLDPNNILSSGPYHSRHFHKNMVN